MAFWGKPKLAGRVPDDDPEPEYLSYGPLYDEDSPGDPEFGAWLDDQLGVGPGGVGADQLGREQGV